MYKTLINKRRKIFTIIISLILVSILFIGGCGKKEKEDVIKIGSVLPLTGKYSYFGNLNQRAIKIAVEKINKQKDYGVKIKYYSLDNQSDTKVGINAVSNLINSKKVDGIITTPSPLCLATKRIVSNTNTVNIALSSHPDLLSNTKNTIRAFLNAKDDVKELANYLNGKKDIDKILIISINDEYGAGLFEEFSKTINKKGMKHTKINFGDTHFKSILEKNNYKEKDALVILSYGSNITINLLKTARELNLKVQIFGTSTFANKTIRNLPSDITNGIIFSTTPFDLKKYNEKAQEFVKIYQKEYDNFVNLGQAYAYDSIFNFIKVQKQNIKNLRNIQFKYYKIFNPGIGVIGKFYYNRKGDIKSETTMGIYENTKIMPLNLQK